MLSQRRHAEILRILARDGTVSAAQLSRQLGVSSATIRRDLIVLEQEERLSRVHGGAVLNPAAEPSFRQVARAEFGGKEAVADAAATMIRDGDSVLLDIGTTVHLLASRLHGRAITVLTSNLAVYEELADDHAVDLVLLGGMVRRNYRSTVGFLTEDALRQVRANRLFFGTSGVRADGSVMDDTVVEVPLKRAMLAAADQVVLLADSGKFPGRGLGRVCGIPEIDILVTNAGSGVPVLGLMREGGVTVIEA
ncbi:DeoR/GlpR family DNA-binding transcription regulator [Amycolatopsis sp. H20-H5]|uniref:DeoR/GlpR family DNA-binding transcription regulator n=1 Tax=Amycolatopsis sp. H20-H5 TaxID=3046309 RepID=UPI002DBABCFE|nr:DeoR/GlpR family DNA-binding transcription regulator [Amycolatopsis sp. H20-H5]MEC3978995.1 DeoR/GlpR family DNA-binding transcription regulator [Amycolatopsis sp. H20-H5]